MSIRKAVHLTSVHPPGDVRVAWRECRSLAEAGYEVVLVAPPAAGGPGGTDRPARLPPGVRWREVPRAATRAQRILRTVPAVYRAARSEAPAIYHLHDPELLPVGLLLRLRGHPVVYDVHEDAPRQMRAKPWIPGPLRPAVAGLTGAAERIAARWLSGIVVANPVSVQRFPPATTVLVRNFPRVEPSPAEPTPYEERRPDVVYVGALSASRGLDVMLEVARRLPRGSGGGSGPRLLVAGRFAVPSQEERARRTPGWERCEYLGWLPNPEVGRLLDTARVGLALLRPTPAYREAYPTKMFEYMLAAVPVVVSDFPLWRDVVDDAGCGVLVDPSHPAQATAAVTWLLEHDREAAEMGRRGRRAVLERYNWAPEARKLLDLYSALEGDAG
ncbi:MAG: glycosyltransferase family 4 protein [Candidatus Palauibacterales bacterium]|nr:glycosyltransferase family 4 protein [Candidatus Palauibacterales bacterium]